MKLIKCYIQNFGILHEQGFEFENGINIIKQDNGFGKTTFAVFIKSMFYGLDTQANARTEKSERKKYMPWQGGIYGGNIEFEINKKKYRIERTFGKKAAEDSFKLYNLDTNLESKDFTENIGEEIFSINKSAYERSTYIPQGQIQIEMEDSINAKLSNVLESDNDINTSDEALSKLKDSRKIYKKERGQGGLIDEKKSKLFDLERKMENNQSDIKAFEERKEQLENKINEIKELESKREELQKLLAKKIEQDRIITKKQVYDGLLTVFKQSKKELNEFEKFFKKGLPTDFFLDNLESKNREIEKTKLEIENCKISDEEEKELETLQEKFKNGIISIDIIDQKLVDCSEIQEIENKLQVEKEKKSKQEEQLKKLKTIRKYNIMFIILSFVLIITGTFVILANLHRGAGIGLIVTGVIVAFYCLFCKKVRRKIINANKEIKSINNELETLKEKKDIINENIDDFIQTYHTNVSINKLVDLTNLKTEYTKYKEIQNSTLTKEIAMQKANFKRENLKREIELDLSDYYEETNKNYSDLIQNLRMKIKEYEIAKNKLKKITSDKSKFEKENDIKEFDNLKEIPQTEEEIKQIIEKSNKEIDKKVDEKNQLKNQIEVLENKIDDNEYIENDISELKKEIELLEEKYKILKTTEELLRQSKESFSSSYLKSMIAGFNKYLSIIDDKALKTAIDTNLDVKIEVNGSQKDVKSFSAGYKDLIYICMRFSLIDALYKDETPFVVLDDPFVNLDESKTSKALEIMNEFAKKYQVIYFSCNSSRV